MRNEFFGSAGTSSRAEAIEEAWELFRFSMEMDGL